MVIWAEFGLQIRIFTFQIQYDPAKSGSFHVFCSQKMTKYQILLG